MFRGLRVKPWVAKKGWALKREGIVGRVVEVMRKTLTIVALALAAALFGCGNSDAAQERMLGYIRDKYGVADSFEVKSFKRESGIGVDTFYSMSFRPKEIPNESFFMTYFEHKTSEAQYYENYLGYYVRDAFESDVMQICSDVDVPIKAVLDYSSLLFDSYVFGDVKNYDDLKRFADATPDKMPHGFGIVIFVSLDDMSKRPGVEEGIFGALEESWFVGDAELIFMPSEDFGFLPDRFGWYVSSGYKYERSERSFG
jgi:hypothetical protein